MYCLTRTEYEFTLALRTFNEAHILLVTKKGHPAFPKANNFQGHLQTFSQLQYIEEVETAVRFLTFK